MKFKSVQTGVAATMIGYDPATSCSDRSVMLKICRLPDGTSALVQIDCRTEYALPSKREGAHEFVNPVPPLTAAVCAGG